MGLPETWDGIEEEVRELFPAIRPRDGVWPLDLETAERRLGQRLPLVLRGLYLRCGLREDLLHGFEHVFPLNRLATKDGVLIFASENQGVCEWGMHWPPSTDDPPVLRKDFTATPVWEPDHDRLPGFLVWFLLWQAVNGGAPAGANGDADASVLEQLTGWRELDRTGCHWTGVRFFVRPGQAVCLADPAPFYVS